jgi:methylmalonyl-CoA mutase N-terminal domain/subunit
VEALTNQIEARAGALIAEIERQGGMIKAIESGWAQRQIAEAAWDYQRAVESGERVVVGVNRFVEGESPRIRLHEHAARHEADQAEALTRLRAERDSASVARALGELRNAAERDVPLMPVLVETVKTYATIGEIFDVLRDVFGEYRAPQIF